MEHTFFNRINNLLQGRSIFLIGMMGSGKSKTGPKLAQLLNYKFIDVDNLVEKVSQKTIYEIFQEAGENTFRDFETQCLKEIIKLPSLVVSTGGGIITKTENWGILRQGIIVWLDINEDIAIGRLKTEIENRPLLGNNDVRGNYLQIFNSRKDLYSQADIRIQVQNQSVEEVSQIIINEIGNKIIT